MSFKRPCPCKSPSHILRVSWGQARAGLGDRVAENASRCLAIGLQGSDEGLMCYEGFGEGNTEDP